MADYTAVAARGLLDVPTCGNEPDPFARPVPDGGLIRNIVNKFGYGWDPEDAFQECCLARLQALRTFDPTKGKWSTWLHFYCRNRLKHARKRVVYMYAQGRVPPSFVDGYDFAECPDSRPEEPSPQPELHKALARLHPRYREVIERRFFGSQTLAEIAVDLGVTRERIRQLQVEAMNKLRPMLQPA